MKSEKGKMLGIVSGKRKKNAPYLNIKIDRVLHEDFVI